MAETIFVGTDDDDVLDYRHFTTNVGLRGLRGNDMLYGGFGNDRMDGNLGLNLLSGGAGNDLFFTSPYPDRYDTVDGGSGWDTLGIAVTSAIYRTPAIRAALSQLDYFMAHDAATPGATFTNDALGLSLTNVEAVAVRVDNILTPITDVVPGAFAVFFENTTASYANVDYTLDSRWAVDGAEFKAGSTFAIVDRDWRMVGTADFNGDMQADVIWQNEATKDVSVWTMDWTKAPGQEFLHGNTVVSGLAGTDWKVFGSADFDSDGRAEILLARTVLDALGNPYADLSLVTLEADGQTLASVTEIPKTATGWTPAALGDFNGDGRSDLLWRDTVGNVSIWKMDGASYLDGDTISFVGFDWSVIGTGDFNADGYSDILWRNDDGRLSIWEMKDMALLDGRTLYVDPGSDWVVAGIADHNGDGKSDIVMRHVPVPGLDYTEIQVWTMDGLDIKAASTLAYVPNDWQTV